MAQGSEDNIDWNDVFMGMAVLTSKRKRSNDPSIKVGACIINDRNIIVGLGCNEIPKGTAQLLCGKDSNNIDQNMYESHAEQNAILDRYTSSVEGCTLYTTLFPCNECAKLIVQSGIKMVIYLSDGNPTNQDDMNIAKKIFRRAVVDFRAENIAITVEYTSRGIIEAQGLDSAEQCSLSTR